jgi:predicted dehydrogenase
VDHYAAATLQFENDVVAQIVTGIACQIPDEVSVYGEEGMLTLSNPWLPSSPCRSAPAPLPPDTAFPSTTIVLRSHGAPEPEEIVIDVDRDLFTYEADTVAENIAHRQAPAMSWDDSLGNMRLLDRWRQEIGLVYEQDKRSQ